MSHPFKKIMLVTNEPANARGAEQTALNLAKANHGSVVIVDSIRTPFHAPRYQSLTAEIMFGTALNAKKEYLESLKTRFLKQGIESTTGVLFSPRTSEDLVGQALAKNCDLIVRYLKGQSSRADGRFGQTAENLMRVCPVPLLMVEVPIEQPKVVACINLEHGMEENQAILEFARDLAASPEDIHVLACWEFSSQEFLLEYDEGMVDQSNDEAERVYQELFEDFKNDYCVDDLDVRLHLVKGNPVTEIPKFCAENEIDVAVMCSASLDHPLDRRMGSTIERVIQHLPCGLMVVKPIGFEGPVKPAENATELRS